MHSRYTAPAASAGVPARPSGIICSIAATVSLAGPSSRSLTTTAAPSDASLAATSAPMPRPDPVTMATLPSSLPMLPALSAHLLVQGDHSGAAEPDVVLQGHRGALDLTLARLAAQLPD